MSRRRSLALLSLAALLAAGCETVTAVLENVSLNVPYGGQALQLVRGGAKIRESYKDLDEPQEIELGRAVTAAVGRQYPLYRDVALTHYVALVGNAVAAQSDRPDMRYVFCVLDTMEVNAFAAPGGYVFVTRGSLAMMRDEAMLAGVLAHEVGHVAVRHHAESIKKQKRTEGQKDMFMAAGDVGLSRVGGGAGSTLRAMTPLFNGLADLTVEGVLKGHSRDEEMEADKVGFKYALRAGYDPSGLKEFLAAMVSRGGAADTTKTFFSTHPALPERVSEQDKLLKEESRPGARNAERFQRALAGSPTG